MSTRRIIRTERFSVSWRRDTTLAGILRRLCRLNWKMLISIQPRRDIPCRARHTGSLLPHSPTLFAPLPLERPFALPSILHDEIKAREGKFYFAPGVSLPVGRRKDRIGELISNARLIRSLAWKKRNGSVGEENLHEEGMRKSVYCLRESSGLFVYEDIKVRLDA